MRERIPPLLFGAIVAFFAALGWFSLISENLSPQRKYGVGVPSLLVAAGLYWWAYRWKNSAVAKLYAEMRTMPEEERTAFYAQLPPDLRPEIDRLQRKEPNQSPQTTPPRRRV